MCYYWLNSNVLKFEFSIVSLSPGLFGKPYVMFLEKLNSSFCSLTLSAVGPCPLPQINLSIVLSVSGIVVVSQRAVDSRAAGAFDQGSSSSSGGGVCCCFQGSRYY